MVEARLLQIAKARRLRRSRVNAIIITAGVPLRTPGSTNMLRIAYVGTGAEEGRR